MNWRLSTTILSGVSIALLVLLLTRGCDEPTTPPQDETLWRTVVDSLNREISDRDAVIREVREKRVLDSIENNRVTSGLVMRNKSLFKKLKEAEIKVPESAEFDRYVELVDSTIAVKDSLYNHEVERRLSEESSFRYEIDELGKKNVQQVQLSEEYKARAESSERKLQRSEKRLERKRKFNHVLLGIVGGLAASTTILILTE